MKVLNLYAGIGGNRKLWQDVEVTAVELDPDIAKIYQDFFPDDTVVVGDAHQYLLDHYKEFDFIWASPPCPSHSRLRFTAYSQDLCKALYPDMKLYEEILLLEKYFDGIYIVENVISWYKPLITPYKLGRHYYWANFKLSQHSEVAGNVNCSGTDRSYKTQAERMGVDPASLRLYKGDKTKLLNNCVDSKIGLHILNCARNIITKQNEKQIDLFQ